MQRMGRPGDVADRPVARPIGEGERLDAAMLAARIEAWQGMRWLVVGDLMLDEDQLGTTTRTSPEAPVPVVEVARTRQALGGAANVARNLASLGASCTLCGVLGVDAEGDRFVEAMEAARLTTAGLVRVPGRVTTHKLRVVAAGRQLVRLDRERRDPLDEDSAAAIRRVIERALDGCVGVILVDYDKGVFADGLGAWLIARARDEGKLVLADPKRDLSRFRGAQLLKPNLAEAHRLLGAPVEFADRGVLLEKLRARLGGGEIVVTRGAEGMSALDESGQAFDVPTRPRPVFDVQGAGDTAAATLALARGSGASLAEACIVANAAGAVVVEKAGTAVVTARELRDRLPEALTHGGAVPIERGKA